MQSSAPNGAQRRYCLMVRGNRDEWGITVFATEATVADWRADGLTVHEIENTSPMWVVDLGLTRVWTILQDVWNWPSRWGRQ